LSGGSFRRDTPSAILENTMEREEARAVWRNTQRQIDDLTYKLGETRDHIDAVATRLDNFIAESATRDRITDQRLRETDSRIDKLISAMGEFLRVLPSQPLP